jgi:hypothetical protein
MRPPAAVRRLYLEVELAEARAAEDAAQAEVEALVGVVKRNQEPVDAEAAQASSDRERALTEATNLKSNRKS